MARRFPAVLATVLAVAFLTIHPIGPGPAGAAEPLSPFAESGAEGERYGYKNAKGEVVIAPRYMIALSFTPGGIAAVAGPEMGWHYIDAAGKLAIAKPHIVDNAPEAFQEGLARYFDEKDRVGYFDESGQIVIRARYDYAEPFSDGLAGFCQDCRRVMYGEHWNMKGGRWGYIDRKGTPVIFQRYEAARPFKDGLAGVLLGGRWITIDRKGAGVKTKK